MSIKEIAHRSVVHAVSTDEPRPPFLQARLLLSSNMRMRKMKSSASGGGRGSPSYEMSAGMGWVGLLYSQFATHEQEYNSLVFQCLIV